MPRILVGCPTYEGYRYCLKEYADRVQSLTYPNYDVALADNSLGPEYSYEMNKQGLRVVKGRHLKNVYERIVESRNLLRDLVLKGKYDYFLSLEQDVIPPANIIEQLIRHNKDVVSGIYYKLYDVDVKGRDGVVQKKKTLLPLIFTYSNDKNKMNVCYPKDVDGDHFFKIRACGLGCVLISRKVLEKVKFRYDPTKSTFDDFLFCSDVLEHGFEIYADTSVKSKHLFLQKGNVFKEMKETPL
ncbi:MAG: hypothetical protein AABX72_00225 [Nanoarchaeota archaeon]